MAEQRDLRRVGFSFPHTGVIIPSLLYHIPHVVGVSSPENMVRITARAVIAFVARLITLWQFAVCQLVTDAMSVNHVSIAPNRPVSILFVSNPLPAIVWGALANIRPEPFFKCHSFCEFTGARRTAHVAPRHCFGMPITAVDFATTNAAMSKIGGFHLLH